MKIVCLLIIILLLCFIIFNTKKEGFNQGSTTNNSKEPIDQDVICNLTGINKNIVELTNVKTNNPFTNYDCTELDLSKYKNLKEITQKAFKNYTQLKTIILPNSIETINQGAFSDCDIKPMLDLSNNTSLKTIGSSAFKNNMNLREISLPISIEKITIYTFYNCDIQPTLDLSINKNLNKIGPHAFSGNKNLRKIILPNSITTIGKGAFEGCPAIEKIIIKELVEGNQCPSNNDNESNAGKLKKLILDSLDETVKNNIECKVLN